MKVYSYWECQFCPSIIRGDSRTCPNCGAPISNSVKYLMPNDPKVIKAKNEGKILIGENTSTFTDENGITSDIVPKDKERNEQNWLCPSCGYQNFAESETCEGCGADKSTLRYFADKGWSKESIKALVEYNERDCISHPKDDTKIISKSSDFNKITDKRLLEIEEEINKKSDDALIPLKESLWDKITFFFNGVDKRVLIAVALTLLLIPTLIWLFYPVNRTATVTGFRWVQSIRIEQFMLCHEDGWTVPAGGRVTDSRREIHHYDTVLDHYETRTRQVSYQVLDGYDTSYHDLGNGQVNVVQTPRYRTEYRTETYQEPVYKQVPVYQTKYYYDIDKWVYINSLTTADNTHEPYWAETDIPEDVESPEYDDLRLGSRSGSYYVIVQNDVETYEIEYNLNDWNAFEIGDELTYKSFRFSYKPISNTEIVHRKDD